MDQSEIRVEAAMLGNKDWKQIDRAVEQAAVRISDELEKMLRKLPDEAAPQMALERLALALVEKQPTLMQWPDLSSGETAVEKSFRVGHQRCV